MRYVGRVRRPSNSHVRAEGHPHEELHAVVLPPLDRSHGAALTRAKRPAEIAVDQIRTVSKARLGAKLGALSADDGAALRRIIVEMYGEYSGFPAIADPPRAERTLTTSGSG